MIIEPLRDDLIDYLEKNQLEAKWHKQKKIFVNDMRHPSLHTELLEPKWRGIYSFRLDIKYRALFFITQKGTAEIFAFTKHYKK
jgi:plasmid maintenance system killer protein